MNSNRLILLIAAAALLLCLLPLRPLQAQPLATTTVRLFTEIADELPVNMRLGFGGEYSDSTDYAKGETTVPGPPPQTFYVLFTDQDIGRCCNKDWSNMDIRGLPDSVRTGTAKSFTQVFELEIFRNIGRKVYMFLSTGLPPAIDSLNIRDFLTGAIFNHTFSGAATDTALMTNDGITKLKLTAYYNLRTVGTHDVAEAAVRGSTLAVWPNPVQPSGRIILQAPMKAGSSVMVTTMLGQIVCLHTLRQDAGTMTLDIPDLPGGAYQIVVRCANAPTRRAGLIITR